MARHRVSIAAKMVGLSRKTLYEHIGKGKVSAGIDHNGEKYIETSELIRVYGDIQTPQTPSLSPSIQQVQTPQTDELLRELITIVKQQADQLKLQSEKLEELKQEIREKPLLPPPATRKEIRHVVEGNQEKEKHSYSDIIKRLKKSRVASKSKSKNND